MPVPSPKIGTEVSEEMSEEKALESRRGEPSLNKSNSGRSISMSIVTFMSKDVDPMVLLGVENENGRHMLWPLQVRPLFVLVLLIPLIGFEIDNFEFRKLEIG